MNIEKNNIYRNKTNNKLNRDKKAVFIITPSLGPDIGGVDSHLESLLPLIKKKVYIIAPRPVHSRRYKDYDIGLERELSVKIIRSSPPLYAFLKRNFDYDWLHKLLFWYLMAYMSHASVEFIKAHRNVGLVHAQEYLGAMIASRLHELFKTPYICTVHSYNGVDKRHFFARMILHSLKDAKAIFTSSSKISSELKHFGLKKITPYHQWLDMKRFYPLKYRRDGLRKKILIIGRISREKGFDKILQILKQHPENDVIFIGEGFGMESLAKTNKHIRFVGAIDNSGLNAFYNDADCTIMPKIVSGNVPRTAMESLAAGTRVAFLDESANKHHWYDEMKDADVICDDKNFNATKDSASIKRCRRYAIENFSSKNAKDILRYYL